MPLREKVLFIVILIAILASGAGITGRVYIKITTAVPDVGGTYTEGMLKEPRIINPIYASTNDTDRDITRLIYSSLITYTGEGALEFDLTESQTTSEDGKVHTFILKKGVLWHDGKELTADDIIFTIGLIQNPQYQSPLRTNWQGVTAEKIDEYTIQFTLRTPYTPFIENLTVGILPKHLWENIPPEQALLHELNLKPVGSGPYVYKEFKQNRDGSITSYEVVRNSRYYRTGPFIKKIKFSFFKTEEELVSALRRRSIDGFGPIAEAAIQEIHSDNISIKKLQIPRTFGLFFNQKVLPLENKNIREAITHALNRELLAEEGVSGGALPHDYPFPPGVGIQIPGEELTFTYEYNPEKTIKILADAGWDDTNEDGILDKEITPKGSKKATTTSLTFTLTTSNWPDLVKTAELIQAMLAEVGVGISVETLPLTELETSVLRPRKFDLLLFGQVYGYEPDPFSFWHSSQSKDPGLNITLYSNKKVDQLLEEARQTADPLTRDQNFQGTAELLLNDIPATFLYSQLYLYVLPSNLEGITTSRISLPADRFNEINRWYFDTKRVLK